MLKEPNIARVSVVLFCPVLAVLVFALAVLAGPANGQRAIEGAQPHPSCRCRLTDSSPVTRLPISLNSPFPSAVTSVGKIPETFAVEGSHLQLEYSVDGLELANLRLYRSYLQYFEGEGFEIFSSTVSAMISATGKATISCGARTACSPQPCGGFR